MGQLMSHAISYASAGRGFPVAQVCANSVSTRFRQRKSLCIAPEIPFSSASRIPKHILRASPISIPSHRRYFLGFLSNTVTFQNT